MIRRTLTLLVAASAALLAGCPAQKQCAPNEQTACACPGGGIGAQTCNGEGTSFGECDCSAPPASCTVANAPKCEHGSCAVSGAFAGCLCQPGYAGILCESCADGFQDNDGNGTCEPTCAQSGPGCSGHGTCADSTGTPACTCEEGYAGADCETCAPTHQDHDHDGVCAPTCATAALACSGHGTCSDDSGAAACVCAEGYAGPDCSTCAEGFQDHDGNGTCEHTCATAPACPAHALCADESGTPTCSCASGYAQDGGTDCVFAGLVQDPTFQNAPVAWTGTDGGAVDPTATGLGTPGVGRLDKAAFCSGATLHQPVDMPPLSAAEGMRLQFDAEPICPGGICSNQTNAVVTLGSMVGHAAPQNPYSATPYSFCLGDGAFGGTRDLTFNGYVLDCSQIYMFDGAMVDNVRIVPDATCPAPGEVANGDFEGQGGWTLAGPGSTPSLIGAHSGVNGTAGGRLQTNKGCQGPWLNGTFSVPEQLPNPALEFQFSGTTGKALEISFDQYPMATVFGPGPQFQTARVCIPPALRGSAPQLKVRLPMSYGGCTVSDVREFAFDDFKVVSDPTCANAAVPNGGFERTDPGAWPIGQTFSYGNPPGFAELTSAQAHSGARSLHLHVSAICDTITASTLLQVPAPQGSAGPAVRYWYKRSANLASFTSSTSGGDLPFTTAWTLRTECLRPNLANLPLQLDFTAKGTGSGYCNDPQSDDLWIDDLEVITDSACPAY